jgi:hypothetical protein
MSDLGLILNKIESMEKKVDKIYIRVFESNGKRSICDLVEEHERLIKENLFSNLLVRVGSLAGAITSISAVIFLIVHILSRIK